MRTLLAVMSCAFSFSTWATVTAGSCPEAFEGKVKAIAESIGPEEAFSTRKVVFTNEQTLRGELPEQLSVEMLANGPFEVEAGKDYRVQLRKGKLCWIEAL